MAACNDNDPNAPHFSMFDALVRSGHIDQSGSMSGPSDVNLDRLLSGAGGGTALEGAAEAMMASLARKDGASARAPMLIVCTDAPARYDHKALQALLAEHSPFKLLFVDTSTGGH